MYKCRNERRRGNLGAYKTPVEQSLVASVTAPNLTIVLLDDNAARGAQALAALTTAHTIPFRMIIVERDLQTVLKQRALVARRWPRAVRSVDVVHGDVHDWLQTRPRRHLQQLIVWLDMESASLPLQTLAALGHVQSGWCTLASRGSQAFSHRFKRYRTLLPRISALSGYQRRSGNMQGMVMYNMQIGRRAVADSDVDYEVKSVRQFTGMSGQPAIRLKWWGFPKACDQHAFYVAQLRRFEVHDDGTVTVQLPGQADALAFTAPLDVPNKA